MIIVSQDKKEITNFDNIVTLEIEKQKYSENEEKIMIIAVGIMGNVSTLGCYDIEERAEEVLQEIVNKYRQYNLDNNKAVTMLPKVYEMPKE